MFVTPTSSPKMTRMFGRSPEEAGSWRCAFAEVVGGNGSQRCQGGKRRACEKDIPPAHAFVLGRWIG